MDSRSQAGSATVEHAGLSLLIAGLAVAAIAAIAVRPPDGARELGTALARKIRCGAVGPGPCWRDPLTEAYGRSLAGVIRALAPTPAARRSASGLLLPVDFRRCRSAKCAAPGPDSPRLTASSRRTTAFVDLESPPARAGGVEIDYWLYRPTLGWERLSRRVSAEEVQQLAPTPLLESDVPALVSLETLAGANHFQFAPGEEPPWRWHTDRRWRAHQRAS